MDKQQLRELFPVTRNLIYLNHAAVGPLSARASEAMQQFARDQRDFGALHWREWYAEIDRLRDAGARLIGAKPQEIAILKNTSEGLSFVAGGFRWERGDNVVTTDLEFPSNYTPWKRLEPRGVEFRVVRSRDGAFDVSDVEPLLDARTRILTVSSVAFHNGFACDLDALGQLCRERNILFCVDAIQSAGVIPTDVRKSNIAFLAADSHKWMCGPEGAALFYVAEEHRDKLEVIESGWTNIDRQGKFIEASAELLPDSRRFEAGSLPTSCVYGARAAIELLLEIGIGEIEREVIRLASKLAGGLESIGWDVRTPRPIRSGIVGAAPPGVEPTLLRWHRKLEEHGVVCAPRVGMLRFATHFFNDDAEIDRVIELLRA